ncbi:MAG TPA: hypothetical protein VJ714_04090 [Anaerolineae bacterium]|jgi:hypothetical protein|nr:hypothetical protein [Anaerolineae bacterium]
MSPSCPFYYEDSHRRFPKRECRLVRRQRASEHWTEKLCRSCPVPEVLEHNPCTKLALEAEVHARFGLFHRIDLYAVCTAQMREIGDPTRCRRGCPEFERA